MRVYLAGKISKHGWRDSLFKIGGYPDLCTSEPLERHYTNLALIGGADYAGPFFTNCDPSKHGCAKGNPHLQNGIPNHNLPIEVIDSCLEGIRSAHLVFAWIDTDDCFGTLFELGFAAGLGKRIVIATNLENSDLWFSMCYAQYRGVLITASTPREAWMHFLEHGFWPSSIQCRVDRDFHDWTQTNDDAN